MRVNDGKMNERSLLVTLHENERNWPKRGCTPSTLFGTAIVIIDPNLASRFKFLNTTIVSSAVSLRGMFAIWGEHVNGENNWDTSMVVPLTIIITQHITSKITTN